MAFTFKPQNPELGGGWLGWSNCLAACGAMMVAFETGGSKSPTPAEFRAECVEPNGRRDTTGGIMPSQVLKAAKEFGVTLDATVLPFEEAWTMSNRADRALEIQIVYSVIAPTIYDGSPGFTGNHAIIRTGGQVYDPLADGRKPGIPKAPDNWPKDLLRRAAGKYANLGVGRAGVIIAKAPAIRPTRYSVAFEPGAFWLYGLDGSRVRKEFSKSTSAPCSAPFTIRWNDGLKRLVQITEGALKGGHVEPGATHVRLVSSR